MKLKAGSNVVIFCLLKTQRLMHIESATLTVGRGTIFRRWDNMEERN